jgi:two-component system, cell cycle response regulator
MLPTILIVDDNEDILEFLGKILNLKYTILKAKNGNEALKMLNNQVVQLVLSDIMMPVMDGLELCKVIKTNFEFSCIPVILLTAKNDLKTKIKGLELGADAYIEKPFSKEYLQAQIASLINNRNIIRKYFASSPLVNIKSMAHSKADESFLENLLDIINKNIEDTDLDVEKLAQIMNMSRITLYRRMKAISVFTPIELINITRLKKGAELLAKGNHKIFEVSYMVGFSSQSNFTRNFHKQFSITPSEYIHSKQFTE